MVWGMLANTFGVAGITGLSLGYPHGGNQIANGFIGMFTPTRAQNVITDPRTSRLHCSHYL